MFTPLLLALVCPALEAPTNGFIIMVGDAPHNYMDSIAEFHCDVTFKLVGEMSLVCLSTERWSSDTPTCTKEKCHILNGNCICYLMK